jgi:hypothetical protein
VDPLAVEAAVLCCLIGSKITSRYYPASSSSVVADYPASASADYPARYVNSADHPATDNPTAVHSASASVNIVGVLPKGANPHFANFTGETKNCFA